MNIELLTSTKDFQIKIGSHRHVVNTTRTVANIDGSETELPQSDISGEPQIIQDLCNALWPLDTSSEKIKFCESDCCMNVNGKMIDADTDVSGESAHVQAFHSVLYSSDFDYAEICRLDKASKEEPKQITTTKTVTKEVESIEIINGKAVKKIETVTEEVEEPVYDEIPLVDEDGNPIMSEPVENGEEDEEGNSIMDEPQPLMHRIPRMDDSMVISAADKDRLQTLKDKLK